MTHEGINTNASQCCNDNCGCNNNGFLGNLFGGNNNCIGLLLGLLAICVICTMVSNSGCNDNCGCGCN